MAYEPKEGTFSLFKNDFKKSEKQPDYKGRGKYLGQAIEVAAWLKETDGGKKYFSCKISEPFVSDKDRPAKEEPEDDFPFD